MRRFAHCLWSRVCAGVLCLGFAVCFATDAAPYEPPRFDRPTLDSMLAPIALYPDRLLSHVLMAATYPREVDEAARWLRARPGLSGDAAVRTAEGWDWDPSVRSLLAFPLVLDTMAAHLRWTQDVGEAFLEQREEVMDVIQQLRRRAYEAGTLRSNDAAQVIDTGYAIVIEPAGPQTLYVPYYDPRVAYGAWWWPARPPMYWPRWPSYYVPPGHDPYFLWGPGIRLSSGFFFGNFVWSRREVRVVDVHPYYYPRRIVVERYAPPGHPAPVIEQRPPVPGVWQHDYRRRPGDEAWAVRRVEPRAPVPARSADERRDLPQAPPARAFAPPAPARPADAAAKGPDGAVRPIPGERPDVRERGARERDRGDPFVAPRGERREDPRAADRRYGDDGARARRPADAPPRAAERVSPSADRPTGPRGDGESERGRRRASGRDTQD